MIKKLLLIKNLIFRSGFHYFRMAMLRPPYWLSINGKTCKIAASDEPGIGSCYAEVVVSDCYALLPYSKNHCPLVIADIGAHIGIFSKLCALLFPNAEIYAYEPNPVVFRWLEENARRTRIKALPYAIGDKPGQVMLDTSRESSLLARIAPDGNLPVQCLPSSQVAEGRPIDLLKMDCESGEWFILKDEKLLKRTAYFCMEYHLNNQHTLNQLCLLIEKGGHQILKKHCWKENQFGYLWSTRMD